MFSRSVWCAAELTHNCNNGFLKQRSKSLFYEHIQFRNSFHKAKARRPLIEPDPLESVHIESGPLNVSGLLKPFIFTIGVTAVSLTGCIIWEYENLRAHASNFLKKPGNWLSAQQRRVYAQNKSDPGPILKWWNSLRDSEKVFYPILAANVLVFGAWKVKSLQPLMVKYFCSNPAGNSRCIPMVLSTFSHYSALHLAANMYVLYSFMPAAMAALGKEQFVAMYLGAGVFSSFTSFFYKVVMNQPGLSLGASGAIMAVLSFVCLQYPDTKLSIIFLPMYTFAAGQAIKVIMSVDLAGVVLGWKLFDHAAHLGGAIFGMAWCQWGSVHIWGSRDKFLQYYHSVRKGDTGG